VFIHHRLLRAPPRRQESIYDLVRSRCGWLLLFFGGLVLAAFVVEAFEEVIKQHVQLAWFGEPGECLSNAVVGSVVEAFASSTCSWRGLVGCGVQLMAFLCGGV